MEIIVSLEGQIEFSTPCTYIHIHEFNFRTSSPLQSGSKKPLINVDVDRSWGTVLATGKAGNLIFVGPVGGRFKAIRRVDFPDAGVGTRKTSFCELPRYSPASSGDTTQSENNLQRNIAALNLSLHQILPCHIALADEFDCKPLIRKQVSRVIGILS